jgi:hypothetical protein
VQARDGHRAADAWVIALSSGVLQDDGDDVAIECLSLLPSGMTQACGSKTIEVA